MKKNCWEIKGCGRQPGGKNANGNPCVAAVETRLDGAHGGKNAGRACWVVAGTMCGGQVQGTHAQKLNNCLQCEFYRQVLREEAGNFRLSATLLKTLRT